MDSWTWDPPAVGEANDCQKYVLDVTGETTAYLRLQTHPGELRGARSLPLVSVIGPYKGPYVVLDFDKDDILVGIEVVGDDREEDAKQPG